MHRGEDDRDDGDGNHQYTLGIVTTKSRYDLDLENNIRIHVYITALILVTEFSSKEGNEGGK